MNVKYMVQSIKEHEISWNADFISENVDSARKFFYKVCVENHSLNVRLITAIKNVHYKFEIKGFFPNLNDEYIAYEVLDYRERS